MKYTYGDSSREHSYEYFNFYLTLKQMGYEVELFDYMEEMKALGRDDMNQRLLERVRTWQPKLAIFSLYADQLDPAIVKQLQDFTKTYCFFHDDSWRVDYSRYWAEQFNYFSTPDCFGQQKYRDIGMSNAIYFPFGCNETIFHKLDIPKKFDVSFVGSWHPYREWLIEKIRKAGIDVNVFGYRWPNGEIDQNRMVEVFNESRINLNLSNSASWDARYLISSPRAFINRIRSKKNIEQMKARMFEVNGCGSFQLSYYVEGLTQCYEGDREIGIYNDPDDLVEKVKFYLTHEEVRESTAKAGLIRTLNEHTFTQRFKKLFKIMGIENG
jgi:spore maturation protein CgeB